MKKSLLLKYIKEEASKEEIKAILDWLDKSPDNQEYFIALKNLWIAQHMPNISAEEKEFDIFQQEIRNLKTNNRYKIISILSSVTAVAAIFFIIVRPSASSIEQKLKENHLQIALADIPTQYLHTLYTESGVKGFIILPDSTQVWLNSETKIVFPDKFIGNTREVLIEGEAYFNVAKDSLKPMIVNTRKGFYIKVLGTEFNLKSYSNDDVAEATLFSGKIDLLYNHAPSNKNTITHVAPNEKAIITKNTIEVISPTEIQDIRAWTEGRLIFESTPLEVAIKTLERWHGVKFNIKDSKVLAYPITATFKSESISQIMEMIKYCTTIDYKIQSDVVEVFAR